MDYNKQNKTKDGEVVESGAVFQRSRKTAHSPQAGHTVEDGGKRKEGDSPTEEPLSGVIEGEGVAGDIALAEEQSPTGVATGEVAIFGGETTMTFVRDPNNMCATALIGFMEVVTEHQELDRVVRSKSDLKTRMDKVKRYVNLMKDSIEKLEEEVEECLGRAATSKRKEVKATAEVKRLEAKVAELKLKLARRELRPMKEGEATTKRVRSSPGEKRPGGPKRPAHDGRSKDDHATGLSSVPASDIEGPEDTRWVHVAGKKRTTKPKTAPEEPQKKVTRVREKGDALILRTMTDDSYAAVLKKLKSDARLTDLGPDVRMVRMTQAGDTIIELRKGATNRSADYKARVEEVMGDRTLVYALSNEVTLRVRDLDEVTTADELKEALANQCKIQTESVSIRMLKGPPRTGTQVALVKLPATAANAVLKTGRLKVGWSVCPLAVFREPLVCYRCMSFGHIAFDCLGEDRSDMCRRCGEKNHIAASCKKPANCLICTDGDKSHVTGSSRCPEYRKALDAMPRL